jgi:drug/metabolite transporter (DMT)-like permease
MTYSRAIVMLLSGAALISFSPVFVKIATNSNLGPTAIGFWRTLIGSAALFGVALARGRSLRLSRSAMMFACLTGFAFFVDLFCWHRSVILAGAGMSTMLGNTQVFATAVISFFVFKEKPGLLFVVAAITGIFGVGLMVGIGSEEVVLQGAYLRGVLYGLATGIAYSNYIVGLKKGQSVEPKPDTLVFVAWASLSSTIFLGIVAGFEADRFFPNTASEILALLGLGILIQGLGWLVISSILPSIMTAHAGLILLLQPVLAMVWGALFFAELLTPLQVVGAGITLAAMYVGSIRRNAKVVPPD